MFGLFKIDPIKKLLKEQNLLLEKEKEENETK